MFRRPKIITKGLSANLPDAITVDIEHLKIGMFIYIKDVEIEKMIRFFEKDLNLSKEKALWLNEEAQKLHKDTNCLRKYIRLINESYTKKEKIKLINIAWKIARADNEVDKYEEHRIRKISELLYLNHSDFIKEKIDTI